MPAANFYCQPADMDSLMAITEKYRLMLIEDAAQAHLAEYRGRKAGGIGHVAGFSFYPGRILGAYGEGGLATTNDPELAHKMRLLRDWGQERKYLHEMLAYNYRMDAIQGADLKVKLRHLENWTNSRRRIAASTGTISLTLASAPPSKRTAAATSTTCSAFFIRVATNFRIFSPHGVSKPASIIRSAGSSEGLFWSRLRKGYFQCRSGSARQLSLPIFLKCVMRMSISFAIQSFSGSRAVVTGDGPNG